MMTSGTNRARGHSVHCGTGCCPMPGLGDRALCSPDWPATSLALCRVMHPPPSNPLSRPHAQVRVEGMGANILLEKSE